MWRFQLRLAPKLIIPSIRLRNRRDYQDRGGMPTSQHLPSVFTQPPSKEENLCHRSAPALYPLIKRGPHRTGDFYCYEDKFISLHSTSALHRRPFTLVEAGEVFKVHRTFERRDFVALLGPMSDIFSASISLAPCFRRFQHCLRHACIRLGQSLVFHGIPIKLRQRLRNTA